MSPQNRSTQHSSINEDSPTGRPRTDDLRIKSIIPILDPEKLMRVYPIEGLPAETLIAATRRAVQDVLHGRSDRLLVIVGPCSIHDPQAAVEYAGRLAGERKRLGVDLEIVMRVYFEKPRTTVGWKGLINDPDLNETFNINKGLSTARELLVQINALGVPAGSEFLDVISPQYIGDLISWGAIGARTTESQVHRELASGISAPIGFKNGTDGNVRIAIDAILADNRRHHFLSVHKKGEVAIVETLGNPDCHVILRGGKKPNYGTESVNAACADLRKAGVPHRLMIDCSHANSEKDYRRQADVAANVAGQLEAGERCIFGVMIESHLIGGKQSLEPGKALTYGQSITDPCLGWDETVSVLDRLAQAVRGRRQVAA